MSPDDRALTSFTVKRLLLAPDLRRLLVLLLVLSICTIVADGNSVSRRLRSARDSVAAPTVTRPAVRSTTSFQPKEPARVWSL